MTFRPALIADIPSLTALINRTYRGESSRAGWTTEADLLSGLRIDETGLRQLFDDSDSLIFTACEDKTILGCIHAHREIKGIHFGLFAVEPAMQGSGIGSALLNHAENHASERWEIGSALMEVITLRTELIAFYERHGYVRTSETVPFPRSALWDLNVSELSMAVLKKDLTQLR